MNKRSRQWWPQRAQAFVVLADPVLFNYRQSELASWPSELGSRQSPRRESTRRPACFSIYERKPTRSVSSRRRFHRQVTLPIVIWVLLPSFDNIPRSIFEAAQVDGCSITRILWKIAIPLVGSGIAVAAILSFVFSWNYFLFALVLSNGDSKTLIAAAFNFVGEGSTQWGALMAAATLIALPPLVLASIVQRWLVSGLTLGAVKG